MNKITLNKFLEDQEKLPIEQRLSSDRIKILKLAAKFADQVNRIEKTKCNHIWELIFIGRTFEGNTHIQIRQKILSPLSLLNAIYTDCPGIAIKCEKAILDILENESR